MIRIMHIVDDPTLALITRFVGEIPHVELSDAEFLLQQISAIDNYVKGFPAEERQKRAMEWITSYAQEYRRQWQKQVATETLSRVRCLDCPLTGEKRTTPCAVHKRWLKLLQMYANGDLSSHDYVQATINLLEAYKKDLKVSQIRQQSEQKSPALNS